MSPLVFYAIFLISLANAYYIHDVRINLTNNPACIELNMTVHENRYGIVNVRILKQVDHIYMRYLIAHTSKGHTNTVFNKTVNICQALANRNPNPMIGAVIFMAKQSMKFLNKCPVNPGVFYNMKVEYPYDMVPLRLFYREKSMILSIIEIFEKPSSDTRVQVFTLQIFGKIEK